MLRRSTRNLIYWIAIPIAGLAALGAVVWALPIRCDKGESTSVVSPDGRHVARLYRLYCSTSVGNSSDGRIVAVRKSGEPQENEIQVFITFDQSPDAVWQDNERLLIVVNGINTIKKSLHKANDVNIVYRLRTGLTEAEVRRKFSENLRRTEENFGKAAADRSSANWGPQYEAFIKWAKENTEN